MLLKTKHLLAVHKFSCVKLKTRNVSLWIYVNANEICDENEDTNDITCSSKANKLMELVFFVSQLYKLQSLHNFQKINFVHKLHILQLYNTFT